MSLLTEQQEHFTAKPSLDWHCDNCGKFIEVEPGDRYSPCPACGAPNKIPSVRIVYLSEGEL